MEKAEKLLYKNNNSKKFRYLDDRVIAGGGCEAVVTTITRCLSRESGKLLYRQRCPLTLKWSVYESNVEPTILYGSSDNYVTE